MSRNSPGVCVRREYEGESSLEFISFIRDAENKRNTDHYTSLRSAGVRVIFNPRRPSSKDYSPLEIWKLEDADLLAKEIVDSLPAVVDRVGIEGFSYGSKGNSGLDIAGYAYSVRTRLLHRYGKNKLCVFSPASVKKEAGKGNAGKEQMMEMFLQRKDTLLEESPFWKGLSEGTLANQKPVDDLVDAYFIQECTTRLLKESLIVSNI